MGQDTAIPGVSQLKTIAEILACRGFQPDNPVTLARYKGIVAQVTLNWPIEKMRCCVQNRNGHLCRKGHGNGWVVRLNDETSSVIGGDCARDKFGVDSTVSQDIARAESNIDNARNEERFRSLLHERDEKLALVNKLLEDVLALKAQMDDFRHAYGKPTFTSLEDLARAGTGQVVVEGITRAVRDNDGEVIRNESHVSVQIGRLNAIRLCNPHTFPSISESLRALRKAYLAATLDTIQSNKTRRELNAAMADHPRVLDNADDLLRDGERFFANDFTPACFMVSDWTERIRAAHQARKSLPADGPHVSDQKWVQRIEESLCKQHKLARIIIAR